MSSNDIKIEIRDLTMAYGSFVIQRNLTFTVRRGDIFIIMGGSGCGKSTLLRHLIGLMPPAQGDVFIDGENFWVAPSEDQERIKSIVDPSLLRFVVRPGMNHHFETFPDAGSAFREEGGRYDAGAGAAIVSWLREQAGGKRDGFAEV